MSKSSAPLIIGGVCCLLSVSAAAGGYLWYDNNQQCANTSANNYTSDATSNAGCTFGCANVSANNYTSTGTSNVSCTYDVIEGCMDPNANTYLATSTSNVADMCTYGVVGCNDDTFAEYGAEYTEDSDPTSCKTLNAPDPDTFRPSTYASEGGQCINTACRVSSNPGFPTDCPDGFKGIGCVSPNPTACSVAGRQAGCVPE